MAKIEGRACTHSRQERCCFFEGRWRLLCLGCGEIMEEKKQEAAILKKVFDEAFS